MRQSLLRALRRSARSSAAHEQPPRAQAQASHLQQQRQVACRQLHSSARVHRPAAPATAATTNASQQQHNDSTSAIALLKLNECIAQREPVQALTLFQQLREPPSTRMLQKLAILLAKQKDAVLVARAYEILQSVYRYEQVNRDANSIHMVLRLWD